MAGSLAAAFGAVAMLAGAGPDPAELLNLSMGPSFAVHVVALISQRGLPGTGLQRVKLERSRDGKTRHTVLYPLHLQGIESVDDGVRSRMFLPDENLLIDRPSALRNADDVPARLRLAVRNYRLRLAGKTRIAGRTANVLVATPLAEELEARKFTIDEATSFPLRLETVSRDGVATVVFDTIDVRFPAEMDDGRFALRPIGRVGNVRYSAPDRFESIADVERSLGFRPILPKALPMGFQVSEMERTQDPRWRALAVRMTDGLVRATLYQWRGEAQPAAVKAFADSTAAQANGIHLLLVGELPPKGRERLMGAFLAPSANGLGPEVPREPNRQPRSFGKMGTPQPTPESRFGRPTTPGRPTPTERPRP